MIKRTSLIFPLMLLLAITLSGCTLTRQQAEVPLEEVTFTLERTPCFGWCPAYTLTIQGDGAVLFDGLDYVEKPGEQTGRISEEDLRFLMNRFQEAGYFDLEDEYTSYDATDMPSAITSMTIGDRTKRIEHYHGDMSAPDVLFELEDLLDERANSAQWIGEYVP